MAEETIVGEIVCTTPDATPLAPPPAPPEFEMIVCVENTEIDSVPEDVMIPAALLPLALMAEPVL